MEERYFVPGLPDVASRPARRSVRSLSDSPKSGGETTAAKSGDLARSNSRGVLCSQFLDDALRGQVWHQQSCDQDRHDNGFRAVDSNIAGRSDPGQHEREYAFERNLQKLNYSHYGQSRAQSHELGTKRDTPVTKKRVTQWRIHITQTSYR